MKVIFMITGTELYGKVYYYTGERYSFAEEPFKGKVYLSYEAAQSEIPAILKQQPQLLIKIEKFFVTEKF